MSIRDDFFTAKDNGALWDVGVSINRTNPLPLDKFSIFKSEDELDTYINGVLSYPGQIVVVLPVEGGTKLYYLDENKTKRPVGSATGDGKSIEVKVDSAGNPYLQLVGFGENYGTENKPFEAGLQLTTVSDGEGGFKLSWQKPDTSTVDGLSSNVETLNTRVGSLEGSTEELERKFAEMGAVLNFVGSITVGVNQNINDVINSDSSTLPADYIPAVGDVILVNGKDEYICVALVPSETDPDQVTATWEQFGDPQGLTALNGTVDELSETVSGNTTTIEQHTEKLGEIETAIGTKPSGATDIYSYITTQFNTAKGAADEAKEAADAAQSTADSAGTAASAAQETANSALEKTNALRTEVGDKPSDATGTIYSRLAAVEGKANTNEENINGINGEIGTDTTSASIKGRIKALENTAGSQTTTLEGHTNRISSLENVVGKEADTSAGTNATGLVADVRGLQTTVGSSNSGLVKKVADLEGAVGASSDTASATGSLYARIAKNKSDIETNASGIDSNAQAIAALQNALNGVSGTDGISARLSQAEQDIDSLELEVTNLKGKDTDTSASVSIQGAKKYTDEKISGVNTTISNLQTQIGNLSNLMNFVGTLEDREGQIVIPDGDNVKTPVAGDVGVIGGQEYLYTGSEWVAFGDVDADSARFTAIERRVTAVETTLNTDETGLLARVSALEDDLSSLRTTHTEDLTWGSF